MGAKLQKFAVVSATATARCRSAAIMTATPVVAATIA